MATKISVTFPACTGWTTDKFAFADGTYEHAKSASTSYNDYSGYDRCVIDGINVTTNTIIKTTTTTNTLLTPPTTATVHYKASFSKSSGLTLSTSCSIATTSSAQQRATGAAYTTEATFSMDLEGYYNADGVKVPDNWATSTVYSEPFGAQHTFTNYLDQDGNPLKGYLVPSSDPWMTDSNASLMMYDEGTQLSCIKKGRAPLFTAQNEHNPVASNGKMRQMALYASGSTVNWVPFHKVLSGEDVYMYRTEDELVIGDTTYYPSDFRDGVIPEYMYILVIGAGGGGGGTKAGHSKGAGGGGAGGCIGAVVNLKLSDEIWLTVGTGGAGGTGGASGLAGSSGGTSSVQVSVPIPYNGAYVMSSSHAKLLAYGASGGQGLQVAGSGGGVGYTPIPSYSGAGGQTYYGPSPFNCMSSTNGSSGNAGTATSSTDTPPTAATTTMILKTAETFTSYLSSAKYHSYILPVAYTGGSDGSTKSDSAGGGAGSILSKGGNGQKAANGTAGGRGAGGGGAGAVLIGSHYQGGAGGAGAILFFY